MIYNWTYKADGPKQYEISRFKTLHRRALLAIKGRVHFDAYGGKDFKTAYSQQDAHLTYYPKCMAWGSKGTEEQPRFADCPLPAPPPPQFLGILWVPKGSWARSSAPGPMPGWPQDEVRAMCLELDHGALWPPRWGGLPVRASRGSRCGKAINLLTTLFPKSWAQTGHLQPPPMLPGPIPHTTVEGISAGDESRPPITRLWLAVGRGKQLHRANCIATETGSERDGRLTLSGPFEVSRLRLPQAYPGSRCLHLPGQLFTFINKYPKIKSGKIFSSRAWAGRV